MNLCIDCANEVIRGGENACNVPYKDPEDGKPELVDCLKARRHECYCGRGGKYFRSYGEEAGVVREALLSMRRHLKGVCELIEKEQKEHSELEFTVAHDGDLLDIYVNGHFLASPRKADISEEALAEINSVIGEDEEYDPTLDLLEKAWEEFDRIQWEEEE